MVKNLLLPFAAGLAAASIAQGQTAPRSVSAAPERPSTTPAEGRSDVLLPTASAVTNPDGSLAPVIRPRTLGVADTTPPLYSDEEIAAYGAAPALGAAPSKLYFDRQDGTHWVRGENWKASVDGTGFTFLPKLGRQASQNWPVRFQLAKATIGGEALGLAAAEVALAGERFVLDRGPVDVMYDVDLGSVEQLFHIESAGRKGEIVLTLDVETELEASPENGGFRFSGPDGGMTYGAAIALDESGAQVEVPAVLEGGELQLTVPANFVANAVGDIVVDPVFSAFSVYDDADDNTAVGMAYERANDAFVYVMEDPFSATDMDVRLEMFTPTGTSVSSLWVDFTTQDWRDPEVACLNGDDVVLAVGTVLGTGSDEIRGRILNASTLAFLAPSFQIADTGTSDAWTNRLPDVAGNSTATTGLHFIVSWERLFSSTNARVPRYTTVDATGTVGALRNFGPTGLAGQFCHNTVLSESNGYASVNTIQAAYVYQDSNSGEELLRVGQINEDGSIALAFNDVLDANVANVDIETVDISNGLVVDGADPACVVVFDDYGVGDDDVTALIVRNNIRVNTININRREHAIESRNQELPHVVAVQGRFVIAYAEFVSGTGWTTHATAVDLIESNQLSIAERRTAFAPISPSLGDGPAIASRASQGLSSRYAGLGWEVFDSVAGVSDITGGVLFANTGLSPAFQYCDGEPNSTGDRGFLRLEGSRAANTMKTAVASALPANQFCLLVAGDGIGNVVNLGGGEGTLCLGGSLGRYNSQITPTGAAGTVEFDIQPANIPFGVSFYTALPGDVWQWQVWHRDTGTGGATSNLTNAVTILFN